MANRVMRAKSPSTKSISNAPTRLPVYCSNHKCSHSVIRMQKSLMAMTSDLEPKFA